MTTVLILMGGQSAEHEVSVVSARNVCGAIDRARFNVVLCGISKSGDWYHIPESALPSLKVIEDATFEPAYLLRQNGSVRLMNSSSAIATIDVAFPVLHGPYGEDGTIQGMFRMLGLPFVGCDVLASAAGMDKAMMKRILSDANIPVVPYITLSSIGEGDFSKITQQLGLPFFVKAACMGSSVGVHKVKMEEDFLPALTNAFLYSRKVLVEKFVPCREIECAVLGNGNPVTATLGEIKPSEAHEFYSYESKYNDPNGAELIIPAILPEFISLKIRQLAIETFKALDCSGLSRVDFFYNETTQEIFVNEVNTMPGFTSISMFPKLFMHDGMTYSDIISTLIDLGIEHACHDVESSMRKAAA